MGAENYPLKECSWCGYGPSHFGFVATDMQFSVDRQRWECRSSINCDARQQERRKTPENVEDFTGKIDGRGVKGSMGKMKLPLSLIPPLFLTLISLVLAFGARKYKPGNWLKGMSWTVVLEGVKRHIMAFEQGEELDPESKLPHLAHAACGIMFLIWFAYGPDRKQYRQAKLDDRQWAPKYTDGSEFPDDWGQEMGRINQMEVPEVKL